MVITGLVFIECYRDVAFSSNHRHSAACHVRPNNSVVTGVKGKIDY